MKIRQGHVSNSSSSSFVVNFPHDPTDINNLRSMMGECYPTSGYGANLTSEEVVLMVHEAITGKESSSPENLIIGVEDWHVERIEQDIKEAFEAWSTKDFPEDLMEKASKGAYGVFASILHDHELSKTPEGYFTESFTFSDEDGPVGCALEHGDIFRNVQFSQTSNH